MKKAVQFTWVASIDLLLDAILGTLWLAIMLTLLFTGLGLIPVLGIGVLLIFAMVSLTRFTSAVERGRANALYELDLVEPPRRPSTGTGFARVVSTAVIDLTSSATWRTLLHHLASSVLGYLAMTWLFWAITTAVMLFTYPLPGSLNASWLARLVHGWLGDSGGVFAILLGVALIIAAPVVIYFAGRFDRGVLAPLLGPPVVEELTQRIETLSDARQGAVDAATTERLRIERDLHDGVQPRLVAVAMTLGMARNKFESDPQQALTLLERAHDETKDAITELRQLARGIHPAVLTDRGLDASLSALASRCAVPTTISFALPTRPAPEVEAVIYFTVAEALTNVSKHSEARSCQVDVRFTGHSVLATVTDDGRGGARIPRAAGGLSGMRDRVRSASGTLTINSPEGGPTVVTVEVPCAL
ncbi:sensor histidine kinase [Diaminobutyricimonas sp. TR449]|uniref:sensor histidine kinase n=1 Tax=Diaminobutyricimonas sp. TR449 TaxID=2708076 RepID=UPI00141FF8FD|nr:sensor histidine kinase [Diaminobutyricimonas sp. TR449]